MEFNKGDLVKFSNPVSAEEEAIIMVVLEDRDTRVLVTVPDFNDRDLIQPTSVYAKTDLISAADPLPSSGR